jgi:MOSC domain-containing protein YiiM/ferredoxin-NADP reductase
MHSELNQEFQTASARLLGIFVGRSAPLGPGKVPSAFIKNSVPDAIDVGRAGLAGDEQADLRVHGGPDMAIYAYSAEHYRLWNSEFPEHASIWRAGALGENLTLLGWDETDVCVGDMVRLGNVLLQVTRPRKPCFKLALRFNDLRLPRRLVESGRCGWYYRVLQTGSIAVNDAAALVHRAHPEWTIRRVNDISIQADVELDVLEELAALPELAENWRSQVRSAASSIKAVRKSDTFRPFRVAAIHDESLTIKSFQLIPEDGDGVAAGIPGQHIVIRPPANGAIQQKLRSYSLSGVPNAQHLQISVKREAGNGISAQLHDHLRIGDCIDVRGPRGNFTLVNASDAPLVLISAGVGITPMMPMLYAATTNNGGKIVPRSVLFIHGARNSSEQAFAGPIRDTVLRHPAVVRHVRFSQPHSFDRLGESHDSIGRIDRELIKTLLVPLDECTVYICGPSGFMADVTKWIGELGLPKVLVKTETFGSAVGSVVKRDGQPDGPERATISFAKSQRSAVWKRGGATLLELAEQHGLQIENECRAGLCGSCATRVLSGGVGYGLELAATIAQDEMLLCCGYPTEDELVLDI